jgi:Glycosyltransferase like family 2
VQEAIAGFAPCGGRYDRAVPEVAFVMSPAQPQALRELVETLRYELELQAVPSSVHAGPFPPARYNEVAVLVDPHAYVALEGEAALPPERQLRRTIFISTQPPPSQGGAAHLDLLRRGGAVVAIDQRTMIALRRLGIAARLVRPGYSRSLDHFAASADRPIDILFAGSHTLRRTRYLAAAARVLARHECRLHLVPPDDDADAAASPGEDRRSLLTQSKLVINLHATEQPELEWRQALDAIHAGAVVVSEHSSGIAPLTPGEHLLVAGPDALPYVAETLLGDPERLALMRAAAYERLSTWIPFALSVSVLRALIVELVGEPVPTAVGPAPPPLPDAPSVAADSDGVPGSARSGLAPGPRAASGRASSDVTALVVADGRDGLARTLDSVWLSRRPPREILVVTTPCAPDPAELGWWAAEHPDAPVRVAQSDGDGVGAARNRGLEQARGELCLVVDPGQSVYPRFAPVLAAALEEAPAAAFAYCIQEVVGAADTFVQAGGDFLLSVYAWAPERLGRGNYIHTPALIRADRLREVGGWTDDPVLEPFVDYDLWCRFAERGWGARHVAQSLARRAEDGGPASLVAIAPPSGEARERLVARAPRLLTGGFAAA